MVPVSQVLAANIRSRGRFDDGETASFFELTLTCQILWILFIAAGVYVFVMFQKTERELKEKGDDAQGK